jgi:hypothetical protein
LPSRRSTLHQIGARVRTRFGHCRSGNCTGGNGRYLLDGTLSMALFRLWRRGLRANTKTPPPFGSGVQEIGVIDLEPCRQAAQQKRSEEQWVLQLTIHADTGSQFRRASQMVFCCSPTKAVVIVAVEIVSSLMNVQIAVLCDAATDYAGKLNLLGTFDTVVTQQLPAVHPQCSVALRIVFSKVEEGQHKVKMNFVDEDGRFVMPSIDIPVDVMLPPDASFVARNFLINIQQLKFEKPGQYAIDIAVDGRQETSIPLQVKQVQPPAKAEQ